MGLTTVVPKTEEIEKTEPTKKFQDKEGNTCACMWIQKHNDGRQSMRIHLKKGFSWRDCVKPNLPNQPDWCPATHFGYLEAGCMEIEMENGDKKTINAGETYLVEPGHLPHIHADAVMVEFSQDTTFTNKEYLEKK